MKEKKFEPSTPNAESTPKPPVTIDLPVPLYEMAKDTDRAIRLLQSVFQQQVSMVLKEKGYDATTEWGLLPDFSKIVIHEKG